MKKQVLAGMLLATMMVGISANDSYAEHNEYRGNMPENGGDLSSPFVITEVNPGDNYLKVIYNGGMEGESRLRNVNIITWNPEGANGNEDHVDWALPSLRNSMPQYAYSIYNKSHYVFGTKFADQVEATIDGSEMMNSLFSAPNMKLYYSLYIGESSTAPESYYTGKVSYERCAGSRVFNREEMTCKVEVKADGSGIQYQPYVIATGERVEVPEDYEVVEPGPVDDSGSDEEGGGEVSGELGSNEEGYGGETISTSETQQMRKEEVSALPASASSAEQVVVASEVRKSAGVVTTTVAIGEEMVVATPVEKKETIDTTEVLGQSLESLGDVTEDKDDSGNIWGVLVSILGVVGALVVGWWLFLLIKRRKEEDE